MIGRGIQALGASAVYQDLMDAARDGKHMETKLENEVTIYGNSKDVSQLVEMMSRYPRI